MPYKKSAARKEFEEVIGYHLNQSKIVSLKKSNIPHNIQQCVYKATIFQVSATLEEYVKSILEDWVYMLHHHKKRMDDLPLELIHWAAGKKLLTAFKKYILYGDEGIFINDLMSKKDVALLFDNNSIVKESINQTEYVRDRKYPSAKNILAVFKRFGINNIFSVINKKGKRDFKIVLSSFSDRRTEIAHQHPSPDLTYKDIVENLGSLKLFIKYVDRVLYSHVLVISGEECWMVNRKYPV